ncbi:MAG: hypothetical protein K9W42_12790 [Candidatus Heimdallarchaeota archaeon]|nr:hypothetical protein [Candidatus Heimdallarchaeota archaeon]
MTDCVLFLHGHQPYYNEDFIVKEIVWQSYGPLFKLLLDRSKDTDFQINLSLTGSVLQWFERLENDYLLSTLGELIDKGTVELLLSPFYHAPLVFTNDGFIKEQFYHHRKMVKDLFGKDMRGLFPPEMIFSTHKNQLVMELDVDYLFVDGIYNSFHTDDVDGLWKLVTPKEIFVLARNRALSWYFSDNAFPNAHWMLTTISKKSGPVTIGCDVECFGHHRSAESFKFLEYFLAHAKEKGVELLTGKEAVKRNKQKAQIYQIEEITTWARSINVFFPHSRIIEMWFAQKEVESMYHRLEFFYFQLEKTLQQTNEDEILLKELIDFKVKKLDEVRWEIHRQLTDAALYHEDFSNENTYRAMLSQSARIKANLWTLEQELLKQFNKIYKG